MRIIGGKFKGRRFYPPAKKWPTRPTTDFSKEGLYNVLSHRLDFEDMVMLDLFGGTGNHCFECISRGCSDATYVDKFYPAIKFVHQISTNLKIQQEIIVVKSDVFKYILSCTRKYSLIFAGPPYGLSWLEKLPDLIFSNHLLLPEGLFVLEHNSNHTFEDHPYFLELRKYSGTYFSFFTLKPNNEV